MINARSAGCGCSSTTVAIFRCERFGEPVLQRAGKPQSCRERILLAAPGYTGRTCQTCELYDTRARPGLRWITRAETLADCRTLAARLSHIWPLRGVAGIPRSGLRAAAIVADYLQCPLGELSREGELRWLDAGRRLDSEWRRFEDGPVIVVDDSVWSGRQLGAALQVLRRTEQDLITATLYQATDCPLQADVHVHRWPKPFLLECHVFGSRFSERTAFDLDGVICRTPSAAEFSDEDAYRSFLSAAEPLSLIRPPAAGLIVTGRSETRRADTEAWLDRYHVQCHGLIMAPWSEIVTTNHADRSAALKAAAFSARPHLRWFIESDPDQARTISQLARKTAICYTTGEVFGARYTQEV
jgi:orotate phosphoribosyltransferase